MVKFRVKFGKITTKVDLSTCEDDGVQTLTLRSLKQAIKENAFDNTLRG